MIVEVEHAPQAPSAGPDEPCAFFLGDRRIAIAQILDRWPSAECTYFKVRDDAGSTYILRHTFAADRWEMVLFQAPDPESGDAVRSHW